MAETLLAVHGFVRYLVLVAGLAAVALALAMWLRRTADGPDRLALTIFTGLLDLQLLLGLILLMQRPFYGALMGHIITMLVAVIVAHVGSVLARRRPPEQSGAAVRCIASIAALVLIVGGISAIGRPII